MQRDKTVSHYHTDPKIITQSRIARYKPGTLLYLDVDGIYKKAVAWSHQESQIAGMVWEVFGPDKISLRVEPSPIFFEHPLGPEWYAKDSENKVMIHVPLNEKIPGKFGDRLWLSDTEPGEMQDTMPEGPFKTIVGYKTKDGFIFRPERLFCCANEYYDPISSSSAEIIPSSSSSSSNIIFVSSSSSIQLLSSSSSSSSSFIPLIPRCRFTYTAECIYGVWTLIDSFYEGCVDNCQSDDGWQGTGCTRTYRYCADPCEIFLSSISGNVSLSGQPLSGTYISITSSYMNLNYNTITDISGNYSYSSNLFEMSASYTITPSLTGYTFTPSSTNIMFEGTPIIANFISDEIPSITGMSTISGTITTSGQGLSGVNVSILSLTNPVSGSYITTTDITGSYYASIMVSMSASYVIIPSLSGYTITPSSANRMYMGIPLVADFSGDKNAVPSGPSYLVSGSDGVDGVYEFAGYGAWTNTTYSIDTGYSSYQIFTNSSNGYSLFYFVEFGVWVLEVISSYYGDCPYYGYAFGGGYTPTEGTWSSCGFYSPTISVI